MGLRQSRRPVQSCIYPVRILSEGTFKGSAQPANQSMNAHPARVMRVTVTGPDGLITQMGSPSYAIVVVCRSLACDNLAQQWLDGLP